MAPRAEHALAPPAMDRSEWSERYAAALRAQLAVLAPNLDVVIQRDALGLTISGAGWAIHAVHNEPNDDRSLSLMTMRGMQTSAVEFAIRHLCLAMAANQSPDRIVEFPLAPEDCAPTEDDWWHIGWIDVVSEPEEWVRIAVASVTPPHDVVDARG